MKKHRLIRYLLPAAAILLLMNAMPLAAADTAYLGGSASALTVNSLLSSYSLGSSGQLPASGGELDAAPTVVSTPLAAAQILTSFTTGSGAQAESEAALGYVVLFAGTPYEVAADFAMSKAVATCAGSYGSAELDSLSIAGQQVAVTGSPNQQFGVLGLVTAVINEQAVTSNGIQVNALDVTAPDGTQVLVGSAVATASCASTLGLSIQPVLAHGVPSTPGCIDFTTGGGWIVPPSGSSSETGPNTKATFGFVAGYKPGGPVQPRGNFEYHDHSSSISPWNIHSDDVLFYNCGPYSNSRVFGGDAELNQKTGYCYEVYVQDNGEPGKGVDYLSVWLWNASDVPGGCANLAAMGSAAPPAIYANGNYLGGGNIEIHMPQ